MNKNYFNLEHSQLIDTALLLTEKIKEGVAENDKEVRCLPTYIKPIRPVDQGINEKILVLDLGGTNFRAAIVEFDKEQFIIEKIEEQELAEVMKRESNPIKRDEFYGILAEIISRLGDLSGITKVGYCFSYPCRNFENADAELIEWTKGVTVRNMVDELVGDSLLSYLNNKLGMNLLEIKVINDTVAALYSGLLGNADFDAYIGLIVGTGTNMAALFPVADIPKLHKNEQGAITINLESGNFNPPYPTDLDNAIDAASDNKGRQRFEKRVSGMYLGSILTHSFPFMDFGKGFDAQGMTRLMSMPDVHKREVIKTADRIYERSAKLVAASLAGLIKSLSETKEINNVCLVAEGGLFYSKDRNDEGIRQFKSYQSIVESELNLLLEDSRILGKNVTVKVVSRKNANLLGSAIAAISPSFR